MRGRFLIVESRFYEDIADALLSGAIAALEKTGASYEKLWVPGALEIPAAIGFASQSNRCFEGYVALGCVIRGETSHYETVCSESARGLMDLSLSRGIAIGNGIITVEDKKQAKIRADISKLDKGGAAARAALELAAIKIQFTDN